MRGDLRGEKITVAAQLHQAGARRGVLAQQREVGRALAGRLDDGEHPPQHRQLRAAVRDVREQCRQQRLQTLAPGLIELAHQRRGTQLEQQPRGLGAVAKARLGQRVGERRGLRLTVPEASQVDTYRRRLVAARAEQHQAEVTADALAVRRERGLERSPVALPHGERDALAVQRLRGQPVHLLVGEHLQAVLEAAQEVVGRAELVDRRVRQQPRLTEARERGAQRRRLQAPVAAAARQLQRLHDEFDLADAAGSELDVVGHLAPGHLALDERAHLAQALEHAVVEIAPIDERAHGGALELGIALGRGDRARLDVGVTLPVASVARQVVLEEREARDQRAGVAERSQAQVDAQHEAIRGRRLQQPHQGLAKAGEELLVADAPLHRRSRRARGTAAPDRRRRRN